MASNTGPIINSRARAIRLLNSSDLSPEDLEQWPMSDVFIAEHEGVEYYVRVAGNDPPYSSSLRPVRVFLSQNDGSAERFLVIGRVYKVEIQAYRDAGHDRNLEDEHRDLYTNYYNDTDWALVRRCHDAVFGLIAIGELDETAPLKHLGSLYGSLIPVYHFSNERDVELGAPMGDVFVESNDEAKEEEHSPQPDTDTDSLSAPHLLRFPTLDAYSDEWELIAAREFLPSGVPITFTMAGAEWTVEPLGKSEGFEEDYVSDTGRVDLRKFYEEKRSAAGREIQEEEEDEEEEEINSGSLPIEYHRHVEATAVCLDDAVIALFIPDRSADPVMVMPLGRVEPVESIPGSRAPFLLAYDLEEGGYRLLIDYPRAPSYSYPSPMGRYSNLSAEVGNEQTVSVANVSFRAVEGQDMLEAQVEVVGKLGFIVGDVSRDFRDGRLESDG